MIKAVTLDLDGTVYLGEDAVEGAAEFVALLRDKGLKYLFVTNRANRLPITIADQLNAMGIPCSRDEVLTSSQATADFLAPAPVYIIGEEGLENILLERGFTIEDSGVKYVIVSFDRSFHYDKLNIACNLIYGGAQFIATNPDKGLATHNGIYPGTGSIVAAVEAGCGKQPLIIGKPEPLILETAARTMGVLPSEVLAVGDNITTDIPSGLKAGMQTALILTGISSSGEVSKSQMKPHFTAQNYAELTDILLSLI